jgi:hypothetical protein
VLREIAEALLGLGGELAGRGKDERARRAARAVEEALHDREQEGGGLAAPRHRAGEQVAAAAGRRDRLPLDRRGLLVSEFTDAAQDPRVQFEAVECHGEIKPGARRWTSFARAARRCGKVGLLPIS